MVPITTVQKLLEKLIQSPDKYDVKVATYQNEYIVEFVIDGSKAVLFISDKYVYLHYEGISSRIEYPDSHIKYIILGLVADLFEIYKRIVIDKIECFAYSQTITNDIDD